MSSLLAVLLFVPQDAPPPAIPLPSGVWRAWLDSPGGDLPFRLEVQTDSDGMRAWICNGDERAPASLAVSSGTTVTFEWGDYDSVLRGEVRTGGTALDGTWDMQVSATKRAQLGFHARYGVEAAAAPPMPMLGPGKPLPSLGSGGTLSGRYRVVFDGEDVPAVGILQESTTGDIDGTILTTLGDYRYLHGQRTGEEVVLACFDGGHAFLFRAQREGEAGLRGKFWSGDRTAISWSAQRDDTAALPDPHQITRAKQPRLPHLSFPDLLGDARTLTDPNVLGEGCVLLVFGSWCPNCHDATDTLVTLFRRYQARGLRVVGLACELTDDVDRNLRVLRTYAQRHEVEWPILTVGTADKKKVGQALPFLDQVVAYPTVVFVDKGGRIRDVYTGFVGPAAPREHQELVMDWRARIEDLLR